MCLIISERNFTWSKPKKVYKIILHHTEEGWYKTLYRNYPIQLPQLNGEKPFGNSKFFMKKLHAGTEIGEGFIHTYWNPYSAWHDFNNLEIKSLFRGKIELQLWECVIPKFSFYYTGSKGDVASYRIYFKKLLHSHF